MLIKDGDCIINSLLTVKGVDQTFAEIHYAIYFRLILFLYNIGIHVCAHRRYYAHILGALFTKSSIQLLVINLLI